MEWRNFFTKSQSADLNFSMWWPIIAFSRNGLAETPNTSRANHRTMISDVSCFTLSTHKNLSTSQSQLATDTKMPSPHQWVLYDEVEIWGGYLKLGLMCRQSLRDGSSTLADASYMTCNCRLLVVSSYSMIREIVEPSTFTDGRVTNNFHYTFAKLISYDWVMLL